MTAQWLILKGRETIGGLQHKAAAIMLMTCTRQAVTRYVSLLPANALRKEGSVRVPATFPLANTNKNPRFAVLIHFFLRSGKNFTYSSQRQA